MTTTYSNLTEWEHPADYGGQTWYGWYAVASQTRDSDALERSNYRRILEDLNEVDAPLVVDTIDPRNVDYDSAGDSTVTDTRQGHWGCGWVEVIYVHSSNLPACSLADSILDALEDYAVYDESAFSEEENEEYQYAWDHYLPSDFAEVLQKHFKLADSTVWKLEDAPKLQALYEELMPSGDYWQDNHMSSTLRSAASRCSRERMAEFLRNMRKGK